MAKTLTSYVVRGIATRLVLSAVARSSLDRIIELLDDSGHTSVAVVNAQLSPLLQPASANRALSRLVEQINVAANDQGVHLAMRITTAKKGGASERRVWFEGPSAETPTAVADELDSIDAAGLIDQLAIDTTAQTAIILTFNPIEGQAIREVFGVTMDKPEQRDGVTYHHLGRCGSFRVIHRVCAQGQSEAQAAAEHAVRQWSPTLIVSTGIACGVDPAKQSIGDVLVAEALWGYEIARVEPGRGGITVREIPRRCSPRLVQRARDLDQHQVDDEWPKLHIGVVLSGNKLVDNVDYRDSLVDQRPGTIGLEMEGLAVQSVCDWHKLDSILVKGISDWGDGKKSASGKDSKQRLAARNAANVVRALLNTDWSATPMPTVPPVNAKNTNMAREVRSSASAPSVSAVQEGFDDAVRQGLLVHDPQASDTSFNKNDAGPDPSAGVNVLDALIGWAEDPTAPPLFALLGEYGMGKSVTCQRLTRELAARRSMDATLPVPLYFDLKRLARASEGTTLRGVVETLMRDAWSPRESPEYNWEAFLDWLRAGAVVIFDGLDEVLVKMDGADGANFTRLLLGVSDVLPERVHVGTPTKVLLTCRTQYFPTLRAQRNHFTGEERADVNVSLFRALTLLPLTEDQIENYLEQVLPSGELATALEVVESIHNLSELAQRPYSLRIIGQEIPRLEQLRSEGRPVQGVTLYGLMVEQWLDRDDSKHRIRREHKLELMESLAGYLWLNGLNALPAAKLHDWFHEWRLSETRFVGTYSDVSAEQLEEDLRTATFLARDDTDGGSVFRFVHTSLGEYFLARYLFGAVEMDQPSRWNVPAPSQETLMFLGQFIAEGTDPASVEKLSAWRHRDDPLVTSLMLRYAIRAWKLGLPTPALTGINLSGAMLDDLVIDGRGRTQALDLSGANFTGASLRRASIAFADLSQAIFDEGILCDASFTAVDLKDASFINADTSGASWWIGEDPEVSRDGVTPWTWLTSGWMRTVTYSPDGTHIATGGDDDTVRVWNASTGEQVRQFRSHSGWVRAVVYSPDGTHIASGGDDEGSIRVWDAATGEQLLRIADDAGWIQAMAYSPTGTHIAAGGYGGTVSVWDLSSIERVVQVTGHTGWIRAVAYSPDGTQIATGGDDGTARVFDATTGEQITQLTGHTGAVRAVAYSPDGTRIVTSGEDDGIVRVFGAITGEKITQITGHTGSVHSVAYSPDGTRIATSGEDDTMRVWDAETGEQVTRCNSRSGSFLALAYSPDGAGIATGGYDRTVRVWDPTNGDNIRRFTGRTQSIRAITYSPDGKKIAAGSGANGDANGDTVRLWDASNFERAGQLAGPAGSILAMVYSPDGTRIATGGYDGIVRTWDTTTGEQVARFIGNGWVFAAAYSPDGTRIATGGGGDEEIVRVRDAVTGEQITQLTGHSGAIRAVTYSPDGTRIATGGDDSIVRIWDAFTGEQITQLTGHNGWILAVTYSKDGTRIASSGGGDRTIRVWDATTGEQATQLTGHTDWVLALAYSPDGKLIASGGDDSTVRVWDAATGEQITQLIGHAGSVQSVIYSPDGTSIATSGDDSTVRVWDAKAGTETHGIGIVGDNVLDMFGYVTWNDDQISRCVGEGWRSLATLNSDGSFRRLEMPGLRFAPPSKSPV